MKLTQFTVEIHLFLFVFFIILAILIGLLYKRKLIINLNDKVYDLEKELMRTNNEILDHIQANQKLTESLDSLKKNTPLVIAKEDEGKKDVRLGKIG